MYRCRYLGVCPFSPKLMGVFLATTLVLHSTALSVSARLVLYRRVASFVVMCFFPSAPSQAGGEGQQTGFCSSHTVSVLFHIRKICAIESSAKSWHWHRQESFPIVGELNVASPSSATWIILIASASSCLYGWGEYCHRLRSFALAIALPTSPLVAERNTRRSFCAAAAERYAVYISRGLLACINPNKSQSLSISSI